MIIFSEKEYAEKLLENPIIRKNPSWKETMVLAKYFIWKYSDLTLAESYLVAYCRENYQFFNEIKDYDFIGTAIEKGEKYPLRTQTSVEITVGEMEVIRSLENVKQRKLLFVMLAISKYFQKGEKLYYAWEISDAYRAAKLTNLNRGERIGLLHSLNNQGLIQATFVNSHEILVGGSDDRVAVVIEDMNNIAKFFPEKCENCGKDYVAFGKRMQLCPTCYSEHRRERNAVSKRKSRAMKDRRGTTDDNVSS